MPLWLIAVLLDTEVCVEAQYWRFQQFHYIGQRHKHIYLPPATQPIRMSYLYLYRSQQLVRNQPVMLSGVRWRCQLCGTGQ